jgi:acetoin utilization deacetylase AcuC-like enzyme
MKVIFHEDFYKVYTSDPAASAGRMEAIVEVVESKVELVEAQPATQENIELAHTKRHIDRVRQSGLFEIASLAAGGAVQAANIGLSEPAFGLIRPPGHHASADSAWGFCFFNNMAVALQALKHNGRIKTAYVLDIDLHFGDGTVNILGTENYVTVHNVKASDRQFFLDEIERELDGCQVDLIGISAGFDNHREDWGGLLLTEDYFRIGQLVKTAAARSGGGCFGILEGGYNHEVLGGNVLALIKGMSAQ